MIHIYACMPACMHVCMYVRTYDTYIIRQLCGLCGNVNTYILACMPTSVGITLDCQVSAKANSVIEYGRVQLLYVKGICILCQS